MARLVIHDLTTNYPRIDQTIANLPNAFFGAFNQAQDQQLKRELGDLSKQKTQLELASLGQKMQSQAAADQAWQSMMGGANSGQSLSLGDLGGPASAVGGAYNANGKTPSFAAIGGSPSPLERQAYDYFIARGWSPAATAGILGNLMAESNLRTNAVNRGDGRDGSDSIGIAQWNGPRAVALRQFAAEQGLDPSTLDAQLAFVDHELRTTERKTGEALRSASDPRAAALTFAGYERPAGWTPSSPERAMHADRRLAHAQRVFTSYGARPEGATQVAQADIPMAGASPVQGFAVPEASQPFTILPNLSTEQLVQLRGLRGLDDQRRGLIDMALKERLDRQNADKPTDDIREYQFYVRQATAAGQQPADFTTWMRDNKKAGAMTVDMTGEREESKAFGKAVGESAAETMKAAGSASKQISQLNNLQQRLEQVAQGRLAPGKMKLTAFAKSLGLNDEFLEGIGLDPQKLGDAQAIQAITGRMVVDMIGSGGFPANNFSDADREFLLSTVPSLANDPRANKLIIETAKRAAQMNIDKARAWRDWKKGNKDGSFFDFETDWIARMQQQDVFGDLRREAEALGGAGAQQAGGDGGQSRPVPVRTEEDFRLLPPGTVFIAPDGTVRRKP